MSKLSHALGYGRNATIPQQAVGFRVTTSAYGLALPLVYGTTRLGVNVMHVVDQATHATNTTQRTGKGGGVTTTNYTYSAAVALGLCEGPVTGVLAGWLDKTKTPWATLQGQGYGLFTGAEGQGAWPYLTSRHPDQAVPYQHTAYVAHGALDLPNNSVPTLTFEVQAIGAGAGGLSPAGDAHPADILLDYCTHPEHGAGIPAAFFGDLSAYRAYCTAAGVFLSPQYTTQQAASQALDALLVATHSAMVWSDGVAKVLPYQDTPITGNGVTYAPNTTPLFDLTDVDFLGASGTDLVTVERAPPSDAVNALQVQYTSRALDYAADVAEWVDQASVDRYGRVQGSPVQLALLSDASTAQLVAQQQVQRSCYVRNTYTCRVGWRYAMLEPMDLITLTDVGLGLVRTPVRITAVAESGAADGLELTCEDWPLGIATGTRYATAAGSGGTSPTGTDPGATVAAVVTAPTALSSAPLELWIAASGGATWGGCEVWWSADGVTYDRAGAITRRGTFGTLTAPLPAGPVDPALDTTHALSVDVGGGGAHLPGAALVGVSDAALAAGRTLWAVGTGAATEFLAWRDATLTGANLYTLARLRRGMYGMPIAGTAGAGTAVLALDDAVFVLPLPQAAIGQTYWLKLPAFNGYGQALQSLSACTPVVLTLTQGPTPSGLVPIVVTPRLVGSTATALLVAVDAPDPLGQLTPAVRLDAATGVPGGTSGVTGAGTDASPYVVPQPSAGSAQGLVTFRATAAGRLDGTATLPVPALGTSGGGTGGGGGGGGTSPALTGVRTAVNRSTSSVAVSWTAANAPGDATYTLYVRVAGDGTGGTPTSGISGTSATDTERANGYTFYTGGKTGGSVAFEYMVTMQSGGATVAGSAWYSTGSIPLAYGGAV